MPRPPFSRGRGGFNRRLSRSISPSPNRHKRSWLQTSDNDRPRKRSLSPVFKGGPRKGVRSSPGYRHSPPTRNRSRSPRHEKRPKWRSPAEGAHQHSRQHAPARPNEFRSRQRSRSRSRSKHRSPSPKLLPKTEDSRRSHKTRKLSPPYEKFSGPPVKKRPRQASPVLRKRSVSRSPDLSFSISNSRGGGRKPIPSRSTKMEESIASRKVSSSSKKKAIRMTLHKRFTLDDQAPFQLNVKDNVTIAILRNASAQPSEDVTVERVFDPTVFKMVHKKNAGRRPIFDREEIKLWKHDENLTDDPDFERRLIRVKSSAPQKVGDSLTRMSPDVLRKAFGLDISGDRSSSRSPKREQQVRLDPRPDPRYEARYRQRMEKAEEIGRRSKNVANRLEGDERRSHERRKDEGRESSKKRSKDDTYDLRQALERRRSDREEDGDSNTDLYNRSHRDRDERRYSDDDRNVVFNNRKSSKYESDVDIRGGRRGRLDGESNRFSFNRGRGGRKGRGGFHFRDDRSSDRGVSMERDRAPSWERRPSFERRGGRRNSISPLNNRGWRGGGGFRGRGRGRGRFSDMDDNDRASPPIDGYFKYSQHDDRDLSPVSMRGRSGRGRRISRGFGSKGFRGNRGFRSSRRPRGGFRIRGRGRGGFGDRDDRDDGLRDVSEDKEWQHDMYESLQTGEEEPHSTTASN